MPKKAKKQPSLYDILGVAKDASDEDLKRAFRDAAKETHPDAGGSAKEFEAVKSAHLVLSDKKRRAHYDETGEVEEPARTSVDQVAIAIIAGLLNNVLGEDPDPMLAPNLVEIMVIFIKKQLDGAEANLVALQRAKKRAEKMLKRFKRKKPGENLMERILASKVIELERLLPQNEKHIACHKRAIEILQEYGFEPEIDATTSFPFVGQVVFR